MKYFIAFTICFCAVSACFGEELLQVPAVVGISSTVSDGEYSLEDIVSAAKDAGFKAVMLTDRDSMRWEYGVWPLRRMIGKAVEDSSISTYGVQRYVECVGRVQKENPDIVLFAGVESAPYYRWEGNPLSGAFGLTDWHKHIISLGLENPRDLEGLPVAGNRRGLFLPGSLKDVFLFWPVVFLVAAVLCFTKRCSDYRDQRGKQLAPYSRIFRFVGALLAVIGLVFFLNNFPFRKQKFDQYSQKDMGVFPYQNYIDYVASRGGMSFWAHPEASNRGTYGKVKVETDEYSRDLLRTSGYTGFGIFHEGYNLIGRPAGLWDELLRRYCRKERKEPVWAMGMLCFDSGDLQKTLLGLRTVILSRSLAKADILKSMKEGKMYVINGADSSAFVLETFTVRDANTGNSAGMGEELVLLAPVIEARGGFTDGREAGLTVRLIKNGSIIKSFPLRSPFNLEYIDENPFIGKGFYRLEISGDGILCVTNPIFVMKKTDK